MRLGQSQPISRTGSGLTSARSSAMHKATTPSTFVLRAALSILQVPRGELGRVIGAYEEVDPHNLPDVAER